MKNRFNLITPGEPNQRLDLSSRFGVTGNKLKDLAFDVVELADSGAMFFKGYYEVSYGVQYRLLPDKKRIYRDWV